VLGLLSGKLEARRQNCSVLAGKSTLNRLEHAPKTDDDRYRKLAVDEGAMKRFFVSVFLKSQPAPPKRIILDLDATDDPIHGDQEGRFFHGYYKCYCYLPLYIFCDRHLLLAKSQSLGITRYHSVSLGIGRCLLGVTWQKLPPPLRSRRRDVLSWPGASDRLVERGNLIIEKMLLDEA
jgi:hypothetical protein